MAPKPKDKKPAGAKNLTADQEAAQRANAVDDIADEGYKKSLRIEIRSLIAEIEKQDNFTGLYNDERLRINYFWLVAKKELEDKQAELRNKEREYQDLEEKHQITIKIYKQKLKHLVFQNLDQLTQLKKEAQITLKNSEDEHRIQQRELKQDLRALKVSKKEQAIRHTEYLNALTKKYGEEATQLRKEFERISNEIQMKYKNKMKLLRENMEIKRKDAISKIEAKKNLAIAKLVEKHEAKYKAIREYYNEITGINMDLINSLKIELNETRTQDIRMAKEKLRQLEKNQEVEGPFLEASEEVKKLDKVKQKHVEIQAELTACQEKISRHEGEYRREEWEYEVKLQQFQYLKQERQRLFEQFHKIVYEVHQKMGLRNLILEKKIETIHESLETKDAQINQIMAAARIDPQALGLIQNTLEEVENLKNETIKEIQTELKKIREAHSNMVKTYEGKLSEFGIPVEELGFDPLVPANI